MKRKAINILTAIAILFLPAFSRGDGVGGQLQFEGHYRRVCHETMVEHIGYTCEARGPCSARPYGCFDKYEIYRHWLVCQLVDSWGNVYRTWEETYETEVPNGCCNICVMRHRRALQSNKQLLACGR